MLTHMTSRANKTGLLERFIKRRVRLVATIAFDKRQLLLQRRMTIGADRICRRVGVSHLKQLSVDTWAHTMMVQRGLPILILLGMAHATILRVERCF